jgi:hypothetical protein
MKKVKDRYKNFFNDSFYGTISSLQTIVTNYVDSQNSTLFTCLVEQYSSEYSPKGVRITDRSW